MSEYKITKSQKAYLGSLVCQRVSDDEANKEIARNFTNKKHPYLARELLKGWNKDKQDKVAYYLVKDPADNQPLLFFSLRCGEMHIPLFTESLKKSVENNTALMDAICGKDAPDWAKEVVEKQKIDGVLPVENFLRMYEQYSRSVKKLNDFIFDQQLEGNNIIRTKKSLAGVELVHFCVHDPAREKWEQLGMGPKRVGKTLFWQFVVPVIQSIRDLVGCEYLYLFAADQSANRSGKLIRYYQDLGFDFQEEMYVTKPAYDLCCYFMCQDVKSLRTKQREYFNNYNEVKEPATP